MRATTDLAYTLGCTVVAKGVETESVRDGLVALGCDRVQGYLV